MKLYSKLMLSFLLGAFVTYVYAEFKRSSDIKSIVRSNITSTAIDGSQKIELVKLVKENKINEYYRIACLNISTDYMVLKDKPFEYEYNNLEKEALEEMEAFLKNYRGKGQCSLSQYRGIGSSGLSSRCHRMGRDSSSPCMELPKSCPQRISERTPP